MLDKIKHIQRIYGKISKKIEISKNVAQGLLKIRKFRKMHCQIFQKI